jgi:hypothetical protein
MTGGGMTFEKPSAARHHTNLKSAAGDFTGCAGKGSSCAL